jgi:hypothetical protein
MTTTRGRASSNLAVRLGYQRIVLETGIPQSAATRLYESSGYLPIDAWPNIRRPRLCALLRQVPRHRNEPLRSDFKVSTQLYFCELEELS